MRKIWDIPGGVHPPENKSQSNTTPITSIPLPKEVILPLGQHIGSEAIAKVAVGDYVLKGQVIAEPQGLVSAPIHASTSGTVTAIEARPIPHASGLNALCIVLECDGKDEWIDLSPCEDYRLLDKVEVLAKIREGGIAGMGGAGFPTAVKLSPHANQKIDTLILNGTECEPYITADDVLMRERADEIIAGAELLAYLLDSPENVIIGIEDNKPQAIAAMQAAAADKAIEVIEFPTKYPSGGEKQLIHILTGKEVPSGGIPAQVGIVVQNVATAAAAYRAVKYGEPLIQRVTTVVGEALNIQRNIEVLLGTPIDHVLQQHDFEPDQCARLIIGGPMMGYAMARSDIPVVKTTNCLLVPSHEEMPEQEQAQPCIRCGMCAQACPASLLPQQLYWYAKAEDTEKLNAHNLFDCIECGACSFVCPSNIPLVQYYRASKGTIRQQEADKVKSDRSRQRFEFRQGRLAKAQAEKEAKRIARKKAAEEAKRLLAEQKDNQSSEQQSATAAPQKAPTKASPIKSDDPDLQRGKLERAVAGAKSRVSRAQEQLETGKQEADQARIESLEARLKQAQQKLSDAESKLAEFNTNGAAVQANPIKEKLALSPREKQEKSIATLKKRIATAEEKLAEAVQSGAASADALQQGVEKLRTKLADAESELASLPAQAEQTEESEVDAQVMSAADIAIEKAKAKTAAMANMSDQEKTQAQIESLKGRLEKAQQRLKKAEEENSEHLDAFKSSVEKLEAKLREAEEKV